MNKTSNTEIFIELVDSEKSEIPISTKFDDEYYNRLYTYYGIINNSNIHGINEIKEIIKGQMRILLENNDNDFIVFKDLMNIKKQIIWQHIVFSMALEPYYSILSFIWDAFRDIQRIKPLNFAVDWKSIIKLAKEYLEINETPYKSSDLMLTENRIFETGTAIKYFIDKYQLSISFNDGYIDLIEEKEIIIYKKIESIIKNIGGINIISCLLFVNQNRYNFEQQRFHFFKNLSDTEYIKSDIPIGYLINISLKYLRNNIEIVHEHIYKDMEELFDITRNYCALYDVQSYNAWEDIFISHENLPYKLHELVLYDTMFTINQFNPYNLRNLLKYLFSFVNSQAVGFDINYYIDFVSDIIENCIGNFKPFILNKKEFYKNYQGLLTTKIDRIFDTFSYNYYEINKEYKFPADYSECNAMFRPFVNIGSNKLFFLNSSICAMSAYESLSDRLRNSVDNLEEKIGFQFEKYVKHLLSKKKISFQSGKYKNGDGECDIIVESNKKILFIEIKKKALTRAAKSGNDVQIFIDLSKSLLDSSIQLNHHEIILHDNNKLELEKYTLQLNGRDIEKMTLVLHDYGSLHDYSICDQILRNVETGGYDVNAPEYKHEFDKINIKSKKLREQITYINSWKENKTQPHFNYKFLCFSQFSIILEESFSDESLLENYLKIKHIILKNHDFYSLYAYANELRKVSSSENNSSDNK
ncbi:MAG: hypothetical protein LBC76_08670 [Treponema sp.]|jgi:hypothetical protein|nr:hypothetical protein [Treponema sp.]